MDVKKELEWLYSVLKQEMLRQLDDGKSIVREASLLAKILEIMAKLELGEDVDLNEVLIKLAED